MRRLVFGLVVLAACGTAAAQQPPPPGLPTPRIQNVFPPGARAGLLPRAHLFGITLRFETPLTATGTDLEEPEKLLFSHPGITAEPIVVKTAAPDPKKKKDGPPPKAAPAGPQRFRVSVAADVPAGTYDVRFVGRWGVSNPRAFVVGNLTEVNEKEPNNDVPEAQRIAIGTTVNGVIANPTDVDYTVFTGKKGQRIVASCLSSSIDGRANPMIEIYDAGGRKLAMNRNYQDNDAVADVILPADGDYHVRIAQFTYQGGGPDHFYRLTVSSAPWIDAVFPRAIEPGKATQVTLYGRNLPNSQPAEGFTIDGRALEKLTVSITPPADAATRLAYHGRIEPPLALHDGFEYVFRGPNGMSNPVLMQLTREPLVVKKNTGGSSTAKPEAIPVPCEAAGFIARRGDSDWYSFEAKKGAQYLVELLGERAGTSADFFLSVRDGKDPKRDLSGELDDDNESLHPLGFFTRTTDPPLYRFTAPEDGTFLVLVGCRESSVLHGPRTAYRLRVSPAQPDFRAIAMPYSRHYQTGSSAWQGGVQAYDVWVHRIDGYAGPVTVAAEGLPRGVAAKPLTIGPNSRWGVLVLSVAKDAPPFTGPITLKAAAAIGDREIVREVRPASVTWGLNTQQIQAPVLSRLDQSLVLAVRPEKAFFSIVPDVEKATTKVNGKDEKLKLPLTVKQGEKIALPVKIQWHAADKQPVILAPELMAQGPQNNPVTAQIPTQPTKDKSEAMVNLDVKSNAPPGTYTIVLKGTAQVPYAKPTPAGGMAKGPNVADEEFSEPILVTVIPSSLAKVTVGSLPNNMLTIGKDGEITIKVERQHDFAGEFTVKFELPKGAAGVEAEEITIPAGKNEAKLTLTTNDDAKPGAIANAVITVAAKYDKTHTITHEVKITFTVAK